MDFKWLVDFLKKIFGWEDETTTTTTVIDPNNPVTPVDEFSMATMHTTIQSVSQWPIISTLTVKDSGSRITLDVDDATRPRWPRDVSINIHCLLFRDGKWHAGPCDGVRPLPSVKDYKCLCIPSGDNRLYEPIKGEKVGVVITTKCRNSQVGAEKFRSSIAWVVGR